MTTTLKPHPTLGAVEAMRLRESFERVLDDGSRDVTVDLSEVRRLSAAGLTAVTHFLARGRRTGLRVELRLPRSAGAREVIEQSGLEPFLVDGGMWKAPRTRHTGHMESTASVAQAA